MVSLKFAIQAIVLENLMTQPFKNAVVLLRLFYGKTSGLVWSSHGDLTDTKKSALGIIYLYIK